MAHPHPFCYKYSKKRIDETRIEENAMPNSHSQCSITWARRAYSVIFRVQVCGIRWDEMSWDGMRGVDGST